ncbi:SIR2 family protein [Synoicihabitans lomoniglobus]|uniref:SIR2 family protein n=1 Tax=Synoicihabitans lomoniglobus TaxID=2909285 RepID=A0AAE9ZU77_9BACT|nr:SIR2 family protein [Opitutaceae bacterium LMO-M01]WED64182.1 SIR2 family protein [Opitutaceae bacterium LMO-M01]
MTSSQWDLAKTTLLLGSGTSQPSGYPLTAEITDTLLSKNWLFDRDQARAPYPLNGVEGNYPLEIEAVWGLLRILRDHISQHLAMHGNGEANYEDIYFLARQLLDGLKGEYDNPGLLPLMFELRTKVSIMMENLNANYGFDNPLKEPVQLGLGGLLGQGIDFIEECVAGQLAPREPINGLQFLNELLATDTKRLLHVVSLNHDTLLEAHFAAHEVLDGFVPISKDVAEFDPTSFDNGCSARVQLLKLHGSIDWFRYKSNSGDDLALKVLSNDRDRVKGRGGEALFPPQNRLMLAGTTNKELAYGSGVFLELMFQFHKRLKETELLIVSGYGFADKGINNRLWAWLDARQGNRLVVLHEKPDELRRDAKPSFSHNVDRHKKSGKFVLVDKWMCNCSLEDVKREIRFAKAESSDN